MYREQKNVKYLVILSNFRMTICSNLYILYKEFLLLAMIRIHGYLIIVLRNILFTLYRCIDIVLMNSPNSVGTNLLAAILCLAIEITSRILNRNSMAAGGGA